MTNDHREDELARMVDDHVAGNDRSRYDLDLIHLPEASELLDIADLLWEVANGAPPLEQDPVAAMLGLVPDSNRSLNPAALKHVLHTAGLKPSTLARQLANRGWDVATRDVFNWQTRGDASVSPALIQAVAEVTGTTADKLTMDHGKSSQHEALASVTASSRFQALAERWARLRGTSTSLGASALEARLAASAFRGDQPTQDQMLSSLEALVAALESRSDEDR